LGQGWLILVIVGAWQAAGGNLSSSCALIIHVWAAWVCCGLDFNHLSFCWCLRSIWRHSQLILRPDQACLRHAVGQTWLI
jgi:hypothetical protein